MQLVNNDVLFENINGEWYVAKIGYVRLMTPIRLVGVHDVSNCMVARCCSECGATNDFVIWVDNEFHYVCKTFADGNYVAIRLLDTSNNIKEYTLVNVYKSSWKAIIS